MIRAEAVIDLDAVEANARRLAEALTGGARLCAVVKAGGYGHGAVPCARAALRGGAAMLAVAAASEASELRAAIPDARLFTMGALSPQEVDQALAAGSEIAVWREGFRELLSERGAALGMRPPVHVKYDSGMGRLGERDAETVAELCRAVAADERLELAGLWTHFATADDRGDPFFGEQLDRFRELAERVRAEHPGVLVHAANSAAALRDPSSHFDMARCGIAVYGLDPFGSDPAGEGLTPALSLRSYVADVKRFDAGASAGYGRTWTADRETHVGVVPIGYGDGYRRGLSNRARVLARGGRHPVVGTVSMDNVTIELGDPAAAAPGDEVILIGRQGDERILAEDLARDLDTINYEVTCGISQRVPRRYMGGSKV